jgi:hypothetical protein
MLQTVFLIGFCSNYLFGPENTRLLALISLSYLPVYFYYVRWQGIFSLKWQLPAQKALIDTYTVLVEILLNIPTIKAFNGYKAASLSFLAQVSESHRFFDACHTFSFQINRQARIALFVAFVNQMGRAAMDLTMQISELITQ